MCTHSKTSCCAATKPPMQAPHFILYSVSATSPYWHSKLNSSVLLVKWGLNMKTLRGSIRTVYNYHELVVQTFGKMNPGIGSPL